MIGPALLVVMMTSQAGSGIPQVSNGKGVQTIRFQRKEGAVSVYLPSDIRPGDTISGTVVSEPAGKDPEEIQKNSGVLEGMVVSVGGASQKGSGTVNFVIPTALAAGLPLVLKSSAGKAQSTYQTPIFSGWPITPPPTTLGPSDFSAPPIAQVGGFLPISGAFDGNAANTKVTIGGQGCPVLAESPRMSFSLPPRNLTGTQSLELKEQGVATTSPVQCLKVTLSAAKTTLMKGERTTVSAQVTGLDGLPESAYPIPFQFTNRTPDHIQMGGGPNISRVLITASAVSGGSWTTGIPIVASIDGPFQVEGTVYFDFNDDRKANLPAKAINAWIANLVEDFEKELKEKENDPAKATRVAILRKVIANLKTVKVNDNNATVRSATLRAVDVQLNLVTALDVASSLIDTASDMLGYQDLPLQNILDILLALSKAGTISDTDLLNDAIGQTAVGGQIKDAKKKLDQIKKIKDALKKLQDSVKKQIGN